MAYVVSSFIDRFIEREKDKSKYACPEDSPYQEVYEYQIVDGKKMLVQCGEKNTQDLIESFSESADINWIISRYLAGDTSVINPYSPMYGDFRNMPKTYAEMFERAQQAENMFNSLPVEIREKFDHSVDKFMAEFDSPQFREIFKEFVEPEPVSEPVPVPTESEVK